MTMHGTVICNIKNRIMVNQAYSNYFPSYKDSQPFLAKYFCIKEKIIVTNTPAKV